MSKCQALIACWIISLSELFGNCFSFHYWIGTLRAMNKYGQSECWMLTPSTDNLVYISHQRQNRRHGDPGGLFFIYGSRVRLSLSTDICQVRFLTISEHLTSDAVSFVYRIMGIVPKIYCNKSHNYTLKSLVEIILNRKIYLKKRIHSFNSTFSFIRFMYHWCKTLETYCK